jgi:soluble lytic murein transglycosylase
LFVCVTAILVISVSSGLARAAQEGDAVALGRGYRAVVDGDFSHAIAELTPVVTRARLRCLDHALYFLGQAELLSGKADSAATRFAKVEKMPGRFQELAAWRAADALWEAGKRDEANARYRKLLSRGPSKDSMIDPAVARFRVGDFRKVYVECPCHPLAEQARSELGVSGATPAERLERAKTLSQGRQWQRALDELALIPSDVAAALRIEVDYWIGTTQYKMRHLYAEAAAKLGAVWERLSDDRRAEARFHAARALSRADRDDEAIVGYRDVVARFPRTRYAQEASFLIGWLDFNRARYREAIPSLEDTIKRYGGSTFAIDARWYLGFSKWMLKDASGALVDFTRLGQVRGSLSGGKGNYWRGRALDALGKQDDAKAAWRGVVSDYPFSHYALLSRVRLRDAGAPVGPFGDGPASHESVTALEAIDPAAARDPAMARVDELLEAGLSVEAGQELRSVETAFMKRLGSGRALPVLFDRYLKAEDFNRVLRLGEAHGGKALRVDPHTSQAARGWWQLMYPLAYRALVEKHGALGKNPTYYLYTIMQKESAYNPHDVSYADAIGLLQMIPPTSRRVAEHVGVPYTDDILYDPDGNIRFGSWYIGHLLQKFKGQIALGAGSYNAGPAAMIRWIEKQGDRSLDEFIELCSYTQTREYMKKVHEIYSRYLYLYDRADYLPTLTIDRTWIADDGIDY